MPCNKKDEMTPGAKDSKRIRLLPFGNPALILHGYIS